MIFVTSNLYGGVLLGLSLAVKGIGGWGSFMADVNQV